MKKRAARKGPKTARKGRPRTDAAPKARKRPTAPRMRSGRANTVPPGAYTATVAGVRIGRLGRVHMTLRISSGPHKGKVVK